MVVGQADYDVQVRMYVRVWQRLIARTSPIISSSLVYKAVRNEINQHVEGKFNEFCLDSPYIQLFNKLNTILLCQD